jgi:hypothetical protein
MLLLSSAIRFVSPLITAVNQSYKRQLLFCYELNKAEKVLPSQSLPKDKTFVGTKTKVRLAVLAIKDHPWNIIPKLLKQRLSEVHTILKHTGDDIFFQNTVDLYQGLYPLSQDGTVGNPCYAT